MIITENKRIILGAILLIIVNIVWVLSSELTNHIFVTENYSKPFLSTYLKSSIFTLFLLGFIISTHWRMLACPQRYYTATCFPVDNSDGNSEKNILSDPIYIPVNCESSDDESNSKRDDDYIMVDSIEINDYERNNEVAKRSVKFSKYSEVRHLSDTYAEDSLAARMSYNASKVLKKRLMIRKIIEQGYLPAINVMKIALQFCFFWFIANYSYQKGLSKDTPAVVNIISCTSSLFTLILGAIFPSSDQDKFNITKLFVVMISMSGVVLISYSEYHINSKFQLEGIIWSLISALGYAIYLVNLRRKVQNENQMSLPMFFGFVGFWTIVCLWPGLIILNAIKVEEFEMPNNIQLSSLLLNGFIGTLGAELLWLWGCFLTSSLTATLSLGLSIPLSMLADYLIKKKIYDWYFYFGSIPILASFVFIAYLTSGSGRSKDPIGYLLKIIFCKSRQSAHYEPLPESDSDDDNNDADNNKNIQSKLNKLNTINSSDQMNIEESDNIIYSRISNILTNELLTSSLEINQKIIETKNNLTDPDVFISNILSINNDSSNNYMQ